MASNRSVQAKHTPYLSIQAMAILYNTGGYIRKIKEYLALRREHRKLMEYQKKGKITRMILRLSRFGSLKEFEEKIAFTKTEIRKSESHLSRSIQDLENILRTGVLKCLACNGDGRLTKVEYIRDEGIHSVLRSYTCTECGGKGEIAIPEEAKVYLDPFIQIANKVIEIGTEVILEEV